MEGAREGIDPGERLALLLTGMLRLSSPPGQQREAPIKFTEALFGHCLLGGGHSSY